MVSECKILSDLLKQYEKLKNQPIKITTFYRGSELLLNYIAGTYDVIFLDIFMNDENGVDCALELRKIDQEVNIIFLTTSSEFGVKSYDVRAVDYLIKPANLDKLSRALGYCKMTDSQVQPTITVPTKHETLEIILDLILYADFQNRSACIHLEDCVVPVSYGSFTELSNQLTAHSQFMVCFKGIVVNLKQIQEVSGNCLILKNGEKLPVSRRLHHQVQQQRLRLSAGSLRGNN